MLQQLLSPADPTYFQSPWTVPAGCGLYFQ